MTFPAVPRDYTVELFLNGGWRDVSSDVRAADGINITRGRPNEASQPQPSTCSMTLDNRSGNYSPRNPLGAWYGLLGRNTPIRVSVNVLKDTFSRTSSDQWGFAETGPAWWVGGGPVADFDVTNGAATHSVTSANALRRSYLRDYLCRDVDVTFTVTLPYADVTGGPITTGIMLRGQDTTNYYLADLIVTTTEAMTLRLWHIEAGVFTFIASQLITDFVYSGQQLWLRAQVTGDTLRSKVWLASGSEPYGWHLVSSDDSIAGAGWVGVRSDIYTGNTNTLPGVFSYDNFVARSVRFVGEVSSWPQRWDTSGIDVTAPIEAASMLRRLAQGTSPQSSTLYRAITSLTIPAVAYWPCEEGSDSNSIASAVGGPAMFVTGDTDFAAYGGFAASYPIPVPQTASTWSGPVPTYTATGEIQLSFITRVPDSGAANLSYFMEMTTQSGRTWSIRYHTGTPALGSMSLQLWEYSTLLFDTGPFAFEVNGKDLRITLTLEQNGSNIDWELQSLKADATGGGLISGTQLNRTVGRALRIRAFPHGEMTGVAMGHISVRKEVVNFWDQAAELRAFAGETVLERLLRLFEQNNIDADFLTRSFGAAVGPQRQLPVLTLLQECADADVSTLFDARSAASLLYRQLSTMYAQPATVTLDYTGGQIAPPFQPVDDDQSTRNDISVTRLNGSTARAVLQTGRMSVRAPELGGVGIYTTAIEVNVARDDQLPDIAGWELNKGIADETRYPVVRVGLHYPEVASDPVLALALLDLDVGDRFEVVNPMKGQTPDTIDQLALGYTEAIYPFEHFLAINAAPASPYRVIVLDDSASKLSTDGSTLTTVVTTTATSLSVTTLSGVLWKTGAVDIPIRVGGEVMIVTNIAGSSSPQTFTVVRSVNGIVKTHPSGSAVALVRPAILAL